MVAHGNPSLKQSHPDLTVLVVEDEAISRRALTALLESSGYPTIPAKSAEEALRLVSNGTVPRIALVDLDLPGMNGIDLISRLEKGNPGILAVLITATSRERLDRLLHEHRLIYFRKPLNFNDLLHVLEDNVAA
jgi:two-component system, NtrC family, response regulator AtoC